jgi:transposase
MGGYWYSLPTLLSAVPAYHYIKKHLPTIIRLPDDVGNKVKSILPKAKPHNTRGRQAVPFRLVFDGILFILRTGCQWKMLPKKYGSGSTSHRRFQRWVRKGVFQKLKVRLLKIYDDTRGINWRSQSVDSASTKAPLGGTRQAAIQQIEAS